MILKTSISLAFAAACLTAVATMPAHAATGSARQNVSQSDHYTRMLETNRGFREARMRKECGPITGPQLHQQCLASFQEYSPVASASYPRKVASSGHHARHYVGSSASSRHTRANPAGLYSSGLSVNFMAPGNPPSHRIRPFAFARQALAPQSDHR
jgi:hypothetical protein